MGKIKIEDIQDAFSHGRVVWRQHALVRILERGLSMVEVTEVVMSGKL